LQQRQTHQTHTPTHTHTHTQREREREREKFSGSILLRKYKTVYEIESGSGEHFWIEGVEEENRMALKRHLS
jgi:hypothetical protein